ncbi:MAG: HEPN domain-containing protein [Aphanizomenon sp.]|jgi:hypothetical protein
MSPTDAQSWMAVANKRGTDAQAIYKERPNSIGSVYMAGYAIECSLKALLQNRGIPFPTHGSDGHNLRSLWKTSGFKLSDLNDSNGNKTFFIKQWDTKLRYESDLADLDLKMNDDNLDLGDLIKGAMELTGWIQTRVRRSKPRKKK